MCDSYILLTYLVRIFNFIFVAYSRDEWLGLISIYGQLDYSKHDQWQLLQLVEEK